MPTAFQGSTCAAGGSSEGSAKFKHGTRLGRTLARLLTQGRPPYTHAAVLFWPLQDMCLFIPGLCTSQYYSWHSTPPLSQSPPVYFAINNGLTRLCTSQYYSCRNLPPLYFAINNAQYMVSPRPPCVAIQRTILVMEISCKGQVLFRSEALQNHLAHSRSLFTARRARRVALVGVASFINQFIYWHVQDFFFLSLMSYNSNTTNGESPERETLPAPKR